MTVLSPVQTLRAVGYFRVSTVGQSGERHSSLETQEGRFREYCSNKGMACTGQFTDVASGRRDDRREYQNMVKFVMDGGADVIVVQFIDRFGRNPREILRRYWELEEHGAQIVATDERIEEELQMLIKAYIAGQESRRNSERTRINMKKAVEKGTHMGRIPYGFRQIKKGSGTNIETSWEINDEEASVIREMYRLVVEENLGFKSIADRLNESGHLTKNGRQFASFTTQSILHNPAIKGKLVWGKRSKKGTPEDIVEVPDFFPKILSEDEWDALQERLKLRRESPRGRTHISQYLLSGTLKCGHCGGPMVGKASNSGKYHYKRYYCSRALKSKAQCSFYNGHMADKLEKTVLDYLGKFSEPAKVREYVERSLKQTDSKSGINARKKELTTVDKSISQLENFLLKDLGRLDSGLLNDDEFRLINEARRTELSQLRDKQAQLSKNIADTANREATSERVPIEIHSFFEDFGNLDIRQQKARLQNILKAIYVWNDNRIEIEFR